jgi:N-acetylglucosamine-6-sulfatase
VRSRTIFVAVVLALLGAGLFGVGFPSREASADAPAPNIVVIQVDDLDEGSLLTAVGGPGLFDPIMPNLASFFFGANSTAFSNSFVTYSLCCPSRATFLTGQYAHNHGVLGNGTQGVGGCWAFDATSTVATWLHDAPPPNNYRTGIIGKYLNGYAIDPSAPETDCRNPHYVAPGWTDWEVLSGFWKQTPNALEHHRGIPQAMYRFDVTNTDGTIDEDIQEYQTQYLSSRSVQFIEQGDPEGPPFFLYVAPTAPHLETAQDTVCSDNQGPRQTIRPYPADEGLADNLALPMPPSFNEPDDSDKPAFVRLLPHYGNWEQVGCTELLYRDRLESLKAVDRLIGAIATAQPGNGRDTVVVFTSDNGFYLGQHKAQGKTLAYEEGIHVPLLVHDPRSTCGNRTLDRFVLNTDLAPTIAALAGVPIPNGVTVDGRSLLPLLEPASCGSLPAWRNRFLVEHWEHATMANYPTFFAVRTADTSELYLETVEDQPQSEYYDLDPDPYQLENTVGDCPTCGGLQDALHALEHCGETGHPTCQSLEDQ